MFDNYYRLFYTFIMLALLQSCNHDNGIPDINVREFVYLSSAKYETLNYAGGYAILNGAGVSGILIYRTSLDKFKAYEMTCPQKIGALTACSILQVVDGESQLKCPCDDTYFHMETGLPTTNKSLPPLKAYSVKKVNDLTLLITN